MYIPDHRRFNHWVIDLETGSILQSEPMGLVFPEFAVDYIELNRKKLIEYATTRIFAQLERNIL